MVRDRVAHRRGRDVGDHHPEPVEVGVDLPVAHANARSPSWRVCDGWIARARPWWRCGRAGGTRPWCSVALVATTASVVLVAWRCRPSPEGVSNGASSGKPGASAGALRGRRSACRRPRRRRRPRSPRPARRPRRHRRARDALPTPPVLPCSPPRHLPTLAPRPAPTRPVANGASAASAAASAARPSSGPGRSSPATTRSKIAAAGTIGTGPPRGGEPAALLGERAHHAVGGGEPERGSAGEHDRVDVLDGGERDRAPRSRVWPGAPPRISTDADRAREGARPRSRRWPRPSSARRGHRGRR